MSHVRPPEVTSRSFTLTGSQQLGESLSVPWQILFAQYPPAPWRLDSIRPTLYEVFDP